MKLRNESEYTRQVCILRVRRVKLWRTAKRCPFFQPGILEEKKLWSTQRE